MALSASWQSVGAPPSIAADRQRRRRVFQAARRHSRLVRRLRVVLPLAGALVVVAFVVATRIGMPEDLDLSAARLSVTPSSIIMERPHLKGFDERKREYSVQADRAVQALATPNAVRLERIAATLGGEGDSTRITAESGDYDRAKNTLNLRGAIAVESSDGYAVTMTDADIDLEAGTLVSPNPTTVTQDNHTTTGQAISVTGGGKVIRLEGGVRTVFTPAKRAPVSPPADEQVSR